LDEPEDNSFILLKAKICEAPILIQPDISKPFQLETDTSLTVCGAILLQQDNDMHWHPVAFLSKSFIEAECNYDIYDHKLLAIIKALEEW